MLPSKIKDLIVVQSNDLINNIIKFPLLVNLVNKDDRKYDRLQHKVLKEGNKINKKESDFVKFQGAFEHRRKGAITYRSYSIEFKKKLVQSIRQEHEANAENISKLIRMAARKYEIHPKNIARWYHTKELKKKEGGRKALFPEMEERLAVFIENNPYLKRKHILRQARKILQNLDIPGYEHFNFSKGWYERFRDRLTKQKIKGRVKLENQLKFEGVKFQDGFNGLETDIKFEGNQVDQSANSSLASQYLVKKEQLYESTETNNSNLKGNAQSHLEIYENCQSSELEYCEPIKKETKKGFESKEKSSEKEVSPEIETTDRWKSNKQLHSKNESFHLKEKEDETLFDTIIKLSE